MLRIGAWVTCLKGAKGGLTHPLAVSAPSAAAKVLADWGFGEVWA